MIYVFDLDGTICRTENGDYGQAEPIPERVERLANLTAEGHTIVISTARGEMWRDFTATQLMGWGVPYHVLSVGAKPYGDVYVDDKATNSEDFF